MVIIQILGWKSEQSWTNSSGQARTALQRRLEALMDSSRIKIKQLAKGILDHECAEIHLDKAPNVLAAESIRKMLEALGAEVLIRES